MDLNVTAEQLALWDRLTTFCDQQIAPVATQIEQTGVIPPELADALTQQQIPALGFKELPDRYVQQILTIMAVAQRSASVATSLVGLWQVSDQLQTYATAPQKQHYLLGDQLMALADQDGEKPVIARATEQGWQLTGTKTRIINGGQAVQYLVRAQTSPKTTSFFMVDTSMAGVQVGSRTTTVGLHGLSVADLQLTDVTVTAAQRIGDAEQGAPIAARAAATGRLLMGAVTVGILTHAQQAIAQLSRPATSTLAQLAELTAYRRALALMVLDAAQQADAHQPWQPAATLASLLASQYSQRQLLHVQRLLGELTYMPQSPLLTLQNDLQTIPIITNDTETIREDYANLLVVKPTAPVAQPVPMSQRIAVSDLHRVVKQRHLTEEVPVNVGSIATAKRIIALGRGAIEPAIILQARQLAKWIGAAIAVTKPLTDLEQFSVEQQVGENTLSVAPEVLINIGIAGDDDYLAGIAGAKYVLSVNPDELAPIFKVSQQAFVGTANDFLDGMVAALN
ncbi:FAD-binding protein [Lactiplantibacillus fabifermentans]|uniref:Acyl-CoA dehydrogenase n=2 Tax=Lactiplantibacillus fabifermentans TaxID=483011 RepID=A0A0R2P1M6_9LACO|nr:FAD-binding protein [Lactiplantibacillus fabifermentans]ETY75718.1 acyl-CoA dehydrogenase [Lactiplantibacillus fabifermentans T30PCM01]KRO28762.1 hypothetical protein DY78_GL001942 [Lactiplantibacillus fabifermentans DSM 21115]